MYYHCDRGNWSLWKRAVTLMPTGPSLIRYLGHGPLGAWLSLCHPPPRPPCSPSEPPQPHDSWCLSGSWGQPSAPSAQGPAAPGPAPFLLGQFHIRGLVCLLLGGRPHPRGQFLTTSNVRKVVLSGDTRAFYKISHAFQTEALHSLSLKYCRVLLSSPQRTHRRAHVHARTQR